MKKAFLIVVMALVLSLAGNGQAAVINVPSDTDLQTALNTAAGNSENDTINIAPGQYNTSGSTFTYTPSTVAPEEDYSLTIAGAGVGNTILDDGGSSDQLMNINTTGLSDDSNAHITIMGITFQNGDHTAFGGGLFIATDQANITVQDCEFTQNTALAGGGAYGVSSVGIVTFTNNTFSGNTAVYGGGAECVSHLGTVIITGNMFSGNSADFDGGAKSTSDSGTITFTNNTFSGNDAGTSGGGGFSIYLNEDLGTANIYNNIAWNNTSTGNGDDIYVDDDVDGNMTGAPVNLYNNDYSDFYIEVGGGTLSQASNINTDPVFVDVSDPDPSNWDLHLRVSSPCIDVGTDSAPMLPATDFEGDPRIMDGDNDSTSTVDMGADEAYPPFVVTPTSVTTGEDGTTATFTVRLTSEPLADVTIPVSSSDTTEGTVDQSSLTFTNLDWYTEQTVTVTGVDDSVADGNQSYTIVLGAATSSDPGYNGLDPSDVAAVNIDDDSADGGGDGCFISNLEGQISIGHQVILVGIFVLGLLVWREMRRC